MKSVYLHIGLHKAGSTYIQRVFSENRDRILEYGVDYPSLGAEFLFGHHNAAWSLMPGKTLQNTTDFSLTHLAQYIKSTPVDKIVLSSEEFDFLQLDHIAKLRQMLSEFDVQVILYIRNPLSAFYSRWQEAVKHGDTTSLGDYYQQILNDPQIFDYFQIANRWTKIFGINSLQVIIYDNLVEQQFDIFAFFLQEVLQIQPDLEDFNWPKYKVNPASGMALVEVIRQLNFIHHAAGKQENFAGIVTKYIFKSEPGKIIQSTLNTIRENPLSYLDLQLLEPIFSKIEQHFIHDFGSQVTNAVSDRKLFTQATSNKLKLPLLDIELLKRTIDLQTLYQNVMSSKN